MELEWARRRMGGASLIFIRQHAEKGVVREIKKWWAIRTI